MFYVFGNKAKRKGLGDVVDFCPICRKLSRLRLYTVSSYDGYMDIALSGGLSFGHSGKCSGCDTGYRVDVTNYKNIAIENIPDFDELVDFTFPGVYEHYQPRLSLEERVRLQLLSDEERRCLIREPFLLLNGSLDARRTSLHCDRTTARLLLSNVIVVGVILLVGTTSLEKYVGKTAEFVFISLLCTACCVSLFALLMSFATDASRYLKREIAPRLVRALAPLRPTAAEILDAVGYARTLGLRIGKRINSGKLLELIQEQLPRQPSLN